MTDSKFEDWDKYWNNFERPNYINYISQIIDSIQQHIIIEEAKILEVGCGTGGNISALAQMRANVTAIDYSLPAIERTTKTAARSQVSLSLAMADANHLPFSSNTFDLIFHQGLLEHFREPRRIIREQKRVLKRGGYILVDVPQRYNIYTLLKRRLISRGEWPYGVWETEFSFFELKNLLREEGFETVDAYARDYSTRPPQMLRKLYMAEQRLFHRKILPQLIWDAYIGGWVRFERSTIALFTLKNIGILAQRTS